MLVHLFDAPPSLYWNSNIYAVQFSPDGTRLAVGSGGWYGGGGITLIDLRTRASTTLRFADCADTDETPAPWEEANHPLTVSGVCFDGSGRYLALATWSSSQHMGPTFLCEVDGIELDHRATLMTQSESIWDPCPTGVCFLGGQLLVRCNARRPQDVFLSFAAPDDAEPDPHAARAHARIAIVGSRVFTGGGGSLGLGGWSVYEGQYEAYKAAEGVLVGPDPVEVLPLAQTRVTAVVATSEGGLITGELDGSIHRWSVRGDTWVIDRCVRPATSREKAVGGAWATYQPESIVGLCRLDDQRWFSVDASGEVCAWAGDTHTSNLSLPRPCTPRTIAVHPRTPAGPLLAVGVKVEGEQRLGYVACFRV